jgi:hypothetical protein
MAHRQCRVSRQACRAAAGGRQLRKRAQSSNRDQTPCRCPGPHAPYLPRKAPPASRRCGTTPQRADYKAANIPAMRATAQQRLRHGHTAGRPAPGLTLRSSASKQTSESLPPAVHGREKHGHGHPPTGVQIAQICIIRALTGITPDARVAAAPGIGCPIEPGHAALSGWATSVVRGPLPVAMHTTRLPARQVVVVAAIGQPREGSLDSRALARRSVRWQLAIGCRLLAQISGIEGPAG